MAGLNSFNWRKAMKFFRFFLVLTFCFGLILPVLGQARTEDEGATLNLSGVKLGTLLKYVANREGKHLLYDERFPKDHPVNIMAPEGVTVPPEKLLGVIESILRMKNYVLVRTGDVLKIIPSAEAAQNPADVFGVDGVDRITGQDRVITQIVPIRHTDVTKLLNLLKPLKSKYASLIPSSQNNMLIVTEFSSNIRRLVKVIRQVDIAPPQYETKVRVLQFTTAQEIKPNLDQYIMAITQTNPPRAGRPQKPFISINERTNAIIVYALEKDLVRINNLIDTLDVQISKKDTPFHHYTLKNTNAEDVAKVLESIFIKQPGGKMRVRSALEGAPRIVAEKTTNSLIIVAQPEVYKEMVELIKDIDLRKNQVLIEAAIVELSMDKMLELGVELASIKSPIDKPTGFGQSAFGLSTIGATGKTPVVVEGMTAGIWKDTVGSIPFLIHAAEKDTEIDVLAVPRILSNDNATASIDISEKIPYDTTTIGPDGTVTGVTFGGYLDAGVKLTITPHISEKEYVRLEIEQSVEQFFDSTYSSTRPAKTSRKTKTMVTIPNKSTVIIGGLTRNNKTKTVQKVPILGDIPILGIFFRKTKTEWKKTNLVVFITPHIMSEFSDLREKTDEYQSELKRLREQNKKTRK